MQSKRTRVATPDAMETLGRSLATSIQPGDWVFLIGTMGAGKSVLAQALLRSFGAVAWMGSPTFTLVNEYDTDPPARHIDLYRLAAEDILDLGLDDLTDPRTVTLVEWADRGGAELRRLAGDRRWLVEIEYVGLTERDVRVTPPSPVGSL